jgi:hypothetical protein
MMISSSSSLHSTMIVSPLYPVDVMTPLIAEEVTFLSHRPLAWTNAATYLARVWISATPIPPS